MLCGFGPCLGSAALKLFLLGCNLFCSCFLQYNLGWALFSCKPKINLNWPNHKTGGSLSFWFKDHYNYCWKRMIDFWQQNEMFPHSNFCCTKNHDTAFNPVILEQLLNEVGRFWRLLSEGSSRFNRSNFFLLIFDSVWSRKHQKSRVSQWKSTVLQGICYVAVAVKVCSCVSCWAWMFSGSFNVFWV